MNYSLSLRIIMFVVISGLWYAGWWHVGAIVTLLYFFWYVGYEVILLGLLLDIQFMTGHLPWYALFFALTFIVVEWCKPRLLAYTN